MARGSHARQQNKRPGSNSYKSPGGVSKETFIQEACKWLRTPEGRKKDGKPNFIAASTKFGIPSTTLRDRWLGRHLPAQQAHQGQMLLTKQQEEILVDWMKKDAMESHPWSMIKLKIRTQELVNLERLPSDDWVRAFNHRHSDILHFRVASGLDPLRAQCFNPGTIGDHFKKWGEIQERYRIKVNFDETGYQLGGGRKQTGRKSYTIRGCSSKSKQRDGNLELVTVLEACCSDGRMLDPGFVFASKGGWTTEWWEGQENQSISVGLTNNGWTDDDQCVYWFENCLVPQLRALCEDDDERILLVFDGHHSHLTDALYDLGCTYKIDFYLLPSHTTHKCQPLDVGVFSPVQKRWGAECERTVEETGQKCVRDDFVTTYMKIRNEVVSAEIVKTAWRKTGLVPFNPNVFTDTDFAPSRPFSTESHLPSSFPIISISDTSPSTTAMCEGSPGPMVVDEPDTSHGAPTDKSVSQPVQPLSEIDGSLSEPLLGPGVPGISSIASWDILLPEQPSALSTPASDLEGAHTQGSSQITTVDMLESELISRYIPLPGPKLPEFSPSPIGRHDSMTRQIEILKDDLSRLQKLYEAEFNRCRAAETHCACAARELKKLKLRLNAKDRDKVRKKKHFGSKAVALMGPDAVCAREEARLEKQKKDQAKVDKENKQAEKDQQAMERRAELSSGASTREFTGALSRMSKQDLEDIAYILAIADFKSQTNPQLRESIKARLWAKEDKYRKDARVARLFVSLDREKAVIDPALLPSSSMVAAPSHVSCDDEQTNFRAPSGPVASSSRVTLDNVGPTSGVYSYINTTAEHLPPVSYWAQEHNPPYNFFSNTQHRWPTHSWPVMPPVHNPIMPYPSTYHPP